MKAKIFEERYLQPGSELEKQIFDVMKELNSEETVAFYRDYRELVALSSSPHKGEDYLELLNKIKTKYIDLNPRDRDMVDMYDNNANEKSLTINISDAFRKNLLLAIRNNLSFVSGLNNSDLSASVEKAFKPVVGEVIRIIQNHTQSIVPFYESPEGQVHIRALKFASLQTQHAAIAPIEGVKTSHSLHFLRQWSVEKRIQEMFDKINKSMPHSEKQLAKVLKNLDDALEKFEKNINKMVKIKSNMGNEKSHLARLAGGRIEHQEEKSAPELDDSDSDEPWMKHNY